MRWLGYALWPLASPESVARSDLRHCLIDARLRFVVKRFERAVRNLVFDCFCGGQTLLLVAAYVLRDDLLQGLEVAEHLNAPPSVQEGWLEDPQIGAIGATAHEYIRHMRFLEDPFVVDGAKILPKPPLHIADRLSGLLFGSVVRFPPMLVIELYEQIHSRARTVVVGVEDEGGRY